MSMSKDMPDVCERDAEDVSIEEESSAVEQFVNNFTRELKCAICLELFAKPVTVHEWCEAKYFDLHFRCNSAYLRIFLCMLCHSK